MGQHKSNPTAIAAKTGQIKPADRTMKRNIPTFTINYQNLTDENGNNKLYCYYVTRPDEEQRSIQREWLIMMYNLANNAYLRDLGAVKLIEDDLILYANYEVQNLTEEQKDELITKRLEMFDYFGRDKTRLYHPEK